MAMWRFLLPYLRCGVSSAKGAWHDTAAIIRFAIRPRPVIPILALGIILMLSQASNAQTNIRLKGCVFDRDDGSPVIGAFVELSGTSYHTVADDMGQYILESIPPGEYFVEVSASGYESSSQKKISISPDVTSQLNFRLSRKTYYLGKVTVIGKRLPASSDRVEILSREQIELSKARDIPQLLETVPGIFVQKSGIAAGKSQIRIRGSAPEHVLVLVDGQRINSSGSGVADLSSIPLEMVERIEIHKGGASAQFGPDALGGVINIITHMNVISHRFSADAERDWGRWKTELFNLNLSNPLSADHFSSKFSYSLRQSAGNFGFSYQVYPDPTPYLGIRVNNFSDADNYFLSGLYQLADRLKLSFSGQYYNSVSGLPGRATEQNINAVAEDRRKLINAALAREFSAGNDLKLAIGFSRFEQHFVDLLSQLKFDSRYTNDIFTGRFSGKRNVMKGNRAGFGAEFRRDILYHTDFFRPQMSMGKTTRDDYSLFLSDEYRFDMKRFFVLDDVMLDASVRFDGAKTFKEATSWQDTAGTNTVTYWSPKIGMVISKGERFSYIVRGSCGKSLRLPSINALFWQSDARSHGNPGLKPEKSEHSEAGFEVRGSLGLWSLGGGMTYFHSNVKDIVVWMPNSGIWQPVNMQLARITGHEDFIELALWEKIVTLTYQNTVTTALNKSAGHTAHDKELVFYPHYITAYMVRLSYRVLNLSYSIRQVDKAYTNEANTRYYDGYRVADFAAGLNLRLNDLWQISADYRLYNVRDKSYVLMTHYPMPGREWNVGIKISFGKRLSQ